MSSCSTENKGEKFKEIIEMTKVIRNCLPSFFGLILQMSGSYITAEEFKAYEEITKHERLGNILKNVKKLYEKLNMFCEAKNIAKPRSLENELDTSCLTNKSELSHKFKNPEQIVEFLMSNDLKISLTEHNSKEGITFLYKPLSQLPWFEDSISIKREGVRVFTKMRTRTLHRSKAEMNAAFLSFEFLKPTVIEKIKNYVEKQNEFDQEEIDQEDPKVIIANHFESDCVEYERIKFERFCSAEQFVMCLRNLNSDSGPEKAKFGCKYCTFVAKNKAGLTNHVKRCKYKSDYKQ